MKTIRLYKNATTMKVAMYIMALIAVFQVYGIRKDGLQGEHIFILSFCAIFWMGMFWMSRDKSPYLILSAKGFSMRARNSRLYKWEEVGEINYHTIGYRTKGIRLETPDGPKDIILKMTTWNGSDLLVVTQTLKNLSFEEREKYIEFILEEEKKEKLTP